MNRSSSTFPPAVATNLREPAPDRTRALLCCGVLAGPIYIAVGLVQALTREGFDLTRHDLSLLANGRLGWVQITNLVVTGLMTIAAAVGIRRSWRGVRGGTWAPLLLGLYGAGLVAAGIFVADPTLGFRPGTPNGPGPVTWHGLLHFVAGGIGFLGLIAACFVVASHFSADRRPGWAAYSRVTGVVFFVGFVGIASGSGNPPPCSASGLRSSPPGLGSRHFLFISTATSNADLACLLNLLTMEDPNDLPYHFVAYRQDRGRDRGSARDR